MSMTNTRETNHMNAHPHLRNMRIGHATNSSSSHSVVMMNPGVPIPQTVRYGREFGWDNFVLADAESKMDYLLIDRNGGYAPGFDHGKNFHLGYIDHDSVGTAAGLPEEFLMNERVVILGGNDNGDRFSIPGATEVGAPTVVKEDGPARIFYWRDTGLKMRFSPEPYTKARTPELVDVKITDYCPYGCFFCYQGSTKEGRHAHLDDVRVLARELARMGTFEVALGGGEPVMHPQFPEIVGTFLHEGITCNATVFGTEWLTNSSVVEAVNKLGGLGVSYHVASDRAKLDKIVKGLGRSRVEVTPQHVVGTADIRSVVSSVLGQNDWREKRLLLLGYKNVGRGADHAPVHVVTDLDLLAVIQPAMERVDWEDKSLLRLSVDTAFVDQYPDLLEHLRVPDYLTSSPEGKFSMYVDLVTRMMGPSSYCDPALMTPYDPDWIEARFAEW